jgi:hypothetical protein
MSKRGGRLPALAACLLLSACSAGTTGATPSAHRLETLFLTSEVVVGPNRLALGLLEDGAPIADGRMQVRFQGPAGTRIPDVTFAYHGDGLTVPGLYVAQVRFERAGDWRAEVTASSPRAGSQSQVRPFPVKEHGLVPNVGSPAPRSQNPTVKDVGDVRLIDSGDPPNDMHQVSIAQAIAAHRPALVVFATPAFCTSRVCGPQVNVVQSLEPKYQDRLAFIHVEIYENFRPDPSKKRFTRTVQEWRLETEPWVFLIDRQGNIAARFEGPTPAGDLAQEIERIL